MWMTRLADVDLRLGFMQISYRTCPDGNICYNSGLYLINFLFDQTFSYFFAYLHFKPDDYRII